MTDEQRDLDNLTKHPGWLLFTEFAHRDIEAKVMNALTNAANDTNDALALNLVRQCVAVRQATQALIGWPESRLRTIAAASAAATTTGQLSRRGNL